MEGAKEDNLSIDWVLAEPLRALQEKKLERIEAGKDALDLAMFNPDIPPPRLLLDKLAEASVKASSHRYAASRGIKKLREAFVAKYRRSFGVTLDPESEVCVTFATKDGIQNALRAACAPGDLVLMGEPLYPAHRSAARLVGLEVATFPVMNSDEGTLQEFERALKTFAPKAALLNFPHNPLGRVLDGSTIQKMAELCAARGIWLINDFVYGEMGYDSTPTSFLYARDPEWPVVESISLSKAYSVPGWRVGALLGNAALIERVRRIKAHADYGLFLPIQSAAAAALSSREDVTRPIVAEYKRRAQVLCSGLVRAGWKVDAPRAGGCVWAKIPQAIRANFSDSFAVAEYVLDEAGILASPGGLFGRSGDDYLRFALVAPVDRLRHATERLEELCGEKVAAA